MSAAEVLAEYAPKYHELFVETVVERGLAASRREYLTFRLLTEDVEAVASVMAHQYDLREERAA